MTAPESAHSCVMAASSSRVILFVEDEEAISAPFSKVLAREGFEPVVARTSADALELMGRIDLDLVLLDLTLPDGTAETSAASCAGPPTSRS